MYNDEQNLYHYTYRKDGTEPGQRYDAKQPSVDDQINSYRQQQEQQASQQPLENQPQPQGGQKPHKSGKNRAGLKIASLALVCALLGGLVGGGTAYLVGNHSGSDTTEVNVSNRKPTEIQVKTVDGKTPMTDAELYASNVNSVVAINITATSEPNFFGQTTETAGAGSGFILTPDGYIVTNYHVVGDADTVKVTLYNGDTYDAQYIGGDEDYDIAVIKIDAANLRSLVRTIRMGKNADFLQGVLFEGGDIDPDAVLKISANGGSGMTELYGPTRFQAAAEAGAEALRGGALTRFEKLCDDAVGDYLAGAQFVPFGEAPLLGYLAARETEYTNLRILLLGRSTGLPADVIRSRLRASYV